MTFNTNRTARKMRQHLGLPKQYTHSPWQWGWVSAVHTARLTTLSSACAAGALQISTAASIEANALIVVGNGGPVQVLSVTGAGPYTVTLTGRGVPNAQASSATVRVLATVDLYLDGWQNPPQNLPPGVTKTLTTGVRFLSGTVPVVGQTGLLARGTGLQRSDRVFIGAPASQSSNWIQLNSPGAPIFATSWSHDGAPYFNVAFRRVGDMVELRGAAVATTGATTTIFTLPVGYRPKADPVIQLTSSGPTNNAIFISVTPAGVVQLPVTPSSGWIVWFDNVSFSVL